MFANRSENPEMVPELARLQLYHVFRQALVRLYPAFGVIHFREYLGGHR